MLLHRMSSRIASRHRHTVCKPTRSKVILECRGLPILAPKLLGNGSEKGVPRSAEPEPPPMRELKFQFSGALLMILTVAAVISAFINFQQQSKFRLPDDGVIWTDLNAAVRARYVVP